MTHRSITSTSFKRTKHQHHHHHQSINNQSSIPIPTPQPSQQLQQQSDPLIQQSPTPIQLSPIPSTSRHNNLPLQPPQARVPLPTGPICSFGPRLGFTYFSNPIPDPNKLNQLTGVDTYWFTIDSLLVYLSFFQDTGPLNCACLYRFCLHLHGLLEDQSLAGKRIMMYSSEDPDKRANSALLISLYCMIVLRWSPADALHPISQLQIQPFRDAGYSRADFQLSIQNVIYGIKRAIDLRLLKLDEFDLKEYEQFEKVENGDYNWLSPHFIAFASPVESNGGRIGKAFRLILDQFEKIGVKLVVRLNKKLYDENRFLERGIAHKEMYFDDGTNPSMEMVREFIKMCDRIIQDGGVVAVHCKAGLGRTGTLIGAYLIYKYAFTAEEAIGFMRIMRPGTCVGPQQHFLYENQMTWVKWAARDELLSEQESQISPSKTERPITPPPDLQPNPMVDQTTPPPPIASGSRPTIQNPIVPGQPRKTPGTKTRHMVTAPETRPTNKSLIENEEDQEGLIEPDCEMELLPPPPPPNLRPSNTTTNSRPPRPTTNSSRPPTGTTQAPTNVKSKNNTGPPNKPNGMVSSPTKPSSNTTNAIQHPTGEQRLRPKPRPASALSDHRKLNDSESSSTGAGPGFRRSKGVKDLGTLFEGLAKPTRVEELPTNRYNLRGGGGGGRTEVSSPSRLPQRIPAKRRGMIGGNNGTIVGGSKQEIEVHAVVPPVNGLVVSGRSVRRRRSSLGVTDVMA